jgi:hypothetical protein
MSMLDQGPVSAVMPDKPQQRPSLTKTLLRPIMHNSQQLHVLMHDRHNTTTCSSLALVNYEPQPWLNCQTQTPEAVCPCTIRVLYRWMLAQWVLAHLTAPLSAAAQVISRVTSTAAMIQYSMCVLARKYGSSSMLRSMHHQTLDCTSTSCNCKQHDGRDQLEPPLLPCQVRRTPEQETPPTITQPM